MEANKHEYTSFNRLLSVLLTSLLTPIVSKILYKQKYGNVLNKNHYINLLSTQMLRASEFVVHSKRTKKAKKWVFSNTLAVKRKSKAKVAPFIYFGWKRSSYPVWFIRTSETKKRLKIFSKIFLELFGWGSKYDTKYLVFLK